MEQQRVGLRFGPPDACEWVTMSVVSRSRATVLFGEQQALARRSSDPAPRCCSSKSRSPGRTMVAMSSVSACR
jgi:hypothetical protein